MPRLGKEVRKHHAFDRKAVGEVAEVAGERCGVTRDVGQPPGRPHHEQPPDSGREPVAWRIDDEDKSKVGLLTIARGSVPLVIFGPHGYGARNGLLGAPARTARARSMPQKAWRVIRAPRRVTNRTGETRALRSAPRAPAR